MLTELHVGDEKIEKLFDDAKKEGEARKEEVFINID